LSPARVADATFSKIQTANARMRNAYHCRRFAVNAKRPSALVRLVDAAFAGADVVKIKLSVAPTPASPKRLRNRRSEQVSVSDKRRSRVRVFERFGIKPSAISFPRRFSKTLLGH
jgi:hypothetical protein